MSYDFSFYKVAEEAKFLNESTNHQMGKLSSVASESRSNSDDEFLYPSYSDGLVSFMHYAHLQETVTSEEAADKK